MPRDDDDQDEDYGYGASRTDKPDRFDRLRGGPRPGEGSSSVRRPTGYGLRPPADNARRANFSSDDFRPERPPPGARPVDDSRFGPSGRAGNRDYGNLRGAASGMRGGRKISAKSEEDDEKKKKRKRLFKLVSNESLCLLVIFSMIGVFNWMSSDYTGEYLQMDRKLGMVKLSLIRRAASVEGFLIYGNSPNLELVPESASTGKVNRDPGKGDVRMEFCTNELWEQRGMRRQKAVFLGKITANAATGTIIDVKGKYKVKLEKNVLASLFRQLQVHLPIMPSSRPPTFFDERQYRERNQTTGGASR